MQNIQYHTGLKTVILTLEGSLFFDDFRDAWLSAIDLLESNNCSRFLIDARRHKTTAIESQIWFKEEFLQYANQILLDKPYPVQMRTAWVASKFTSNYIEALEIAEYIKNANFAFLHQVFEKHQNAMDWLFQDTLKVA